MSERKTKIYMGLPSTGWRNDVQHYALRAIEKEFADCIELVYPDKFIQRIFHDFARNGIVEQFLETDCDILWFLDADVVPPVEVLNLVKEHKDKWMVAGAPYPVFMQPEGEDFLQVVMCVYDHNGQGLHAANVPTKGTGFVAGLATGCMFIKREVFAELKKPYFEFKYDPETRRPIEGEDLGFCFKMHDLGYEFFTDYAMVCRHMKEIDLYDVNNYAMTYAQKSVDKFDRMIKPQVEELANKYKAAVVEIRRLQQLVAKPKSSIFIP